MTATLFGGPSDGHTPKPARLPSRKRILITVKAAPHPSTLYGETVCVAGLSLDEGTEGWVRLYPINFRHIQTDRAFRKYDVVTVDVRPANEPRYESWKPAIDSLRVETHLDTWVDRMRYLAPFADDTMCDLNARHADGPSLGLVKTREVVRLKIEDHPGWTEAEQAKINAYMNQGELFDSGQPKNALEPPRYNVSYIWRCAAPDCRTHYQQILDWEMVAFQRRLPRDRDVALAMIRRKWFEDICSPRNSVHFYVGNQAKRHNVFRVLGVVYPRR